MRDGPFFGAGLAAGLTFSAFGEAPLRGARVSRASGGVSPPSAFSLRTVSTRPPVARRARSDSDSLRGAFSLASNL